jgi:hypothetical protein
MNDYPISLPNDANAEKSLLCSLLKHPEGVSQLCRDEGLNHTAFHIPANGEIYLCINDMLEAGIAVDVPTLATELNQRGKLAAVGNFPALTEIEMYGAAASNSRQYVNAVMEKAKLRGIYSVAEHMRERALEPGADPNELGEHLAERINSITAQKTGLAAIKAELEARLAHPDDDVPEDVPVYSINGTPICYKGNITMIEAQAKAGKTAFLGALMASTYSQPGADCLGWQSRNLEGRAVIHFDTEQSRADHHALTKRVHARAGASFFPKWLRSYRMVGMTTKALNQAVEIALRSDSQKFGGVHSLIIDGIGDLVPSVNDEAPSTDIVTWLMGLANEYQIPIIVVLHLNPIAGKGQTSKARGHLGSQLYRKVEHTLRLEKNADQVTTVTSVTPRKAPLTADSAPCFCWSDEQKRHISTDRPQTATAAKDAGLRELAAEVFRESGGVPLRYSDLVTRIKKETGRTSNSTAEDKIAKMVGKRIILKQPCGGYLLA